MKKRLIKNYFNMVEIALALAILAIGMSSILVLFPVGINANKSAIADNNLADIAEYLMGYLRAGCAAEWAKIAKDREEAEKRGETVQAPGSQNFSFSSKIQIIKKYDDVEDLGDEGKGIDLDKDYDRVTDNLYQLQSNSNSAFLYKQMTGDIVDFAAVVKVWREEYSFYVLDPAKDFKEYGKITVGNPSDYDKKSVNQYATALCIEISWPAQAPYKQREKRLFRQEIFNEAYKFYPDSEE